MLIRKRQPYFELKGWLVENGIKQKQLAETLGIPQTSINHKLNGTGPDFTLKESRRLVEIYGIPASLFLQ
ncbi:hypothetical protein Q757_05860 [Oenococcus alcoholitolerans]|uniref:HTH cro/C1-type domain-containing protein n=1 Tax=Oenococcus alcoholitolerans TaxID=931074 RepID=A0ABR4XRH0_9LACO|nr:hypothetical protein Q757_05860 [Oenococcus alcoholitolerans]